jgi:hypothetical protein
MTWLRERLLLTNIMCRMMAARNHLKNRNLHGRCSPPLSHATALNVAPTDFSKMGYAKRTVAMFSVTFAEIVPTVLASRTRLITCTRQVMQVNYAYPYKERKN